MERQHLLMESEDDELAEYSADGPANLPNFSTSSHALHPSSPAANACISPSIATIQPPPLESHPLSPVSALRRRRYSFLQHLAVDDVLLRVFEFIDCSSLVRTGTTCHRFRELATRSAEQRTQRLADGRLLRSAMRMLRAQEQIEGVGPREGATVVPIPMLGLRRRVRVAGAGDPEYNGIYFCTGSNGNGFLFTKPRSPERRVRVPPNDAGDGDRDEGNNLPALDVMHQLVELDGVGGVPAGDAHHHIGGGEGEDGNNGIAFFAVNGAVGLDVNLVAADEDNDGVNRENGRNGEREDSVDILFGDEPNRSRLLRCVIAKRFSNEVRVIHAASCLRCNEGPRAHQLSLDNFVVHEQRNRRRNNPSDIAELQLLGKTPGHWRCPAGCVPISLAKQHLITEWRTCVAASYEHGGCHTADCGAIGRLTNTQQKIRGGNMINILKPYHHSLKYFLYPKVQ